MQGVWCAGQQVTTSGSNQQGRQIVRCVDCGPGQVKRSASAFSGYRFRDEIIARAVR